MMPALQGQLYLAPLLGAACVALIKPGWVPLTLLISSGFGVLLPGAGVDAYAPEWALAGALAGLAPWLARQGWPKMHRALWLAGLPLVAVLGLHAWAPGPMLLSFKSILRMAELWLGLALPMLLLPAFPKDKAVNYQGAAAFVALASAFGCLQSWLGPAHAINRGHAVEVFSGSFQAAYSFFGHHNQFAVFLTAGLPFMAALAFSDKPRRRVWGLLAALALAGFACCFSRGAWLGLALGSLAAGLFLPGPWKWALPGMLLSGALAMASLGGDAFRARLATAFTDPDRRMLMGLGWSIMDGHGLWGAGAGSVAAQLPAKAAALGRDADATRAFSSHLHNLYLQQMVEYGLAGLLGLLILVATPWVLAWNLLRNGLLGGQKAWALALLASGLAFGAQSFTDNTLLHARGLDLALLWGLMLHGASAYPTKAVPGKPGDS
jgi:hypothetical protein